MRTERDTVSKMMGPFKNVRQWTKFRNIVILTVILSEPYRTELCSYVCDLCLFIRVRGPIWQPYKDTILCVIIQSCIELSQNPKA
jgi:hypothetical protein